MDEVDFTILAATSVLGDLIDKCPPAEACRDAFDRMSKATVQMCMSTTGFSSSAQGLNSRRRLVTQDSDYFTSNNNCKPTFDMGLNDLLGPSDPRTQSPMERFRAGSLTPGATAKALPKSEFDFMPTTGIKQNTSSTRHSPINYAASPALDTSAIDPSLLPSSTSYSTVPVTSQQPFQNPTQFPDLTFPSSYNNGMDFLGNGNGWDDYGSYGNVNWGGDLGVGLGWEGVDHDFSEGGNGGLPDLFEGFFFGGTAG